MDEDDITDCDSSSITARLDNDGSLIALYSIDILSMSSKKNANDSFNEALIVYKANETGETKREIVYGPAMYSPTAKSEWFHSFKWHYPDQVLENKGKNP